MKLEIDPDDFVDWVVEYPHQFNRLFREHLLNLLLELEADDYFGTEGFNKRFA